MFDRLMSLNVLVTVLVAALLGMLFIKTSSSVLFIFFPILLFLFAAKNPLRALSVFLVLIPFTGTSFFLDPLLNLPGTKPLDLMALFVILVGVTNFRKASGMPGYALVFIILVIVLFSFSILRSISHLDVINGIREEKLSVFRYYMSDYIKPIIYLLPFVMIIKFARTIDDLEYILDALCVSIVLLSIMLLYLFIFKVPDKKDVDLASDVYASFTNLHRNDLANFYILGFPVVLSRVFVKKNAFSIGSLCVTLCAVGPLYSRTAYFSIILTSVLYPLLSKRLKALPILVLIVLLSSLFVSSTVFERALVGVGSKDVDKISAGRTDQIWIPLIREYAGDPQRLLLGNGRYAILSSNAASKGEIIDVIDHPHNMYLELILDVGLLGFCIMVGALSFVLSKAYRLIRGHESVRFKEYHYGIVLSLICFLVAGMSGRSFFPMLANSFFWVMLGVLIASAKILNESPSTGHEEA